MEDREIVLPTSSQVEDLRESSRTNGRRSLHFFLTAVCEVEMLEPEVAAKLQELPAKHLQRLGLALEAWARLRGAKPAELSEALRWLFPELAA